MAEEEVGDRVEEKGSDGRRWYLPSYIVVLSDACIQHSYHLWKHVAPTD